MSWFLKFYREVASRKSTVCLYYKGTLIERWDGDLESMFLLKDDLCEAYWMKQTYFEVHRSNYSGYKYGLELGDINAHCYKFRSEEFFILYKDFYDKSKINLYNKLIMDILEDQELGDLISETVIGQTIGKEELDSYYKYGCFAFDRSEG